MIRPITILSWILVLGSGLYLYRAKHEVQLIDKRIAQISSETDALRAASRRKMDEWTRLGEPEQLHKYSDQFLGLKSVSPAQFVRVSDLASRLPAPRTAEPAEETVEAAAPAPAADGPTPNPVPSAATPPPPPPRAAPVSVAIAPPVPAEATPPAAPRPAAPDAVAAKPKPAPEPKLAEEPRPVPPKPVAAKPAAPVQQQGQGLPPLQAQSTVPGPAQSPVHHAEIRPAEAKRDPRPAQPYQAQPYATQARAPAPARPPMQESSLLGMSRGPGVPMPLPLPAPMPVSANMSGR